MWAIAGTADGTHHEYKVTKLFTGNNYLFRVYAENRVGPGEPATIENPVIAKLPYGKFLLSVDFDKHIYRPNDNDSYK